MPADPPAPDVEDLHGSFQLLVGEGHDVSVGAVTQHHRLLLQRPPQRGDVVAQPRGPLEIQFRGGGSHLVFNVTDQSVGLTCKEVAEVTHDPPVLRRTHPADARRRTLVDVAE